MPQIVAGHVIAEVGELDALPLAFATTFPLHATSKYLASHQLQPLQLSAKRRGQQGDSLTLLKLVSSSQYSRKG